MNNLDVTKIGLQGRHIIEASAGTGKTDNIITLYTRLLLEKKLLPKDILVMTFTKDATQEIISRVETKLREEIAKYTPEKRESEKEIYQHLKRALLEIDEAAILTIHGFCKKVLSEHAFASGIEMDVSMEVDTSDILQKVVEDYFIKNINKSETNYQYFKEYSVHTPEKFLDRNKLLNVVKSGYEILTSKDVLVDDIYSYKKDIKSSISSSLSVEIRKYITQKGFDEAFERVLIWLESKDINIPSDVYLIIKGNLKVVYKNLVSIPLKELIGLINDYNSFMQSQFIQKACYQIRENFIKAKKQKGVLDFNDLISKLCEAVKSSPELVQILQKQYPVALIDEFQDTDAEQYQILDTIYPLYRKDLLFLMIGDPKQAIYGFRGGDIFTYLKAKSSCNESNVWIMDTNWRSTREMIKAYNRLFYAKDYEDKDIGCIAKDIFSEGIDYQTVKASYKADEKKRDFGDNLKPINYFYYESSDDDNRKSIDKKLSNWTAKEIVRLLNSKKAQEKDIAILVESSTQAKAIQKALQTKKLSSVYLSQRSNVYKTKEAKEILQIMHGLEEYENKSLLKKALSTSLLGGSSDSFIKYLDEDNIDAWDNEIQKAKELRAKWHTLGFMSLIMHLIKESFKLRSQDKDRVITNILHLAELIKIAENNYKPNQLIKWYREQLESDEVAEGELRLESDDNLIQIITIHGSKGLEYPIVFIPFASYVGTKKFQSDNFSKYYDETTKQTVYKIGKCADVKEKVEQEIVEELQRLFYVAVTRSEQRCYIGVAKYQSKKGSSSKATDDSYKSAIAQFVDYQKDNDWQEKIQQITNNLENESLLINASESSSYRLESDSEESSVECVANDIIIQEDDRWQMLSFSKLSKKKSQYIGLDKEDDELDESEQAAKSSTKDNLEFRFTVKKGADIGNILHNTLEHTDFTTADIDDDILNEQMAISQVVPNEDFDNLKQWLIECLKAPIVDIATDNSFALKDIANNKTLKEVEFYFPIDNSSLNRQKIFKLLAEYRGQSHIDIDTGFEKVFGMLHGFIDLIFEYNDKFYVADYKSNYIGDKLEDYTQEAMCAKNQESFYDLQYLIYSTALDKYLKQHVANYTFEEHFGGVYYFYLRGLKNGYGVYIAQPSPDIITKLSNLFIGVVSNV